ncbi:GntR family transcriptional regulator [Bacillus sp. H-16]|uniref:GntR family transcriptional regulator n=1 Tax=Alteribacter salitolerans TaxID=2912333 RepID=UPI001965B886|nr:GntR family transcriptional regulator [Alteribacter salitolerans]MBM7095965.1 GntR family transcriptional regulator [Alteribacter salitolerans]
MIDKSSPVPIYYQLEELLRNKIDSKDLCEGDLIPSERALSEKYEISRMTIRQAVTNLVNEGLLVREKGKGTFVAKRKVEQPIITLTGFSEDMRSRGMDPGTKLIQFEETTFPPSVCKKLKLETDGRGYQMKRVRLADGLPMAYEVLSIPETIFSELSPKRISNSFYEYVESLGLVIGGAEQTIEPSIAKEEESRLLGIDNGSPVLLMKRVSRLDNGVPFEFVKSVYRGDRYKFFTEMRR